MLAVVGVVNQIVQQVVLGAKRIDTKQGGVGAAFNCISLSCGRGIIVAIVRPVCIGGVVAIAGPSTALRANTIGDEDHKGRVFVAPLIQGGKKALGSLKGVVPVGTKISAVAENASRIGSAIVRVAIEKAIYAVSAVCKVACPTLLNLGLRTKDHERNLDIAGIVGVLVFLEVVNKVVNDGLCVVSAGGRPPR